MKIEKKDFIYGLIILFVFLFSMYNMNKANQLNQDATKYEQTISALNDSIKKVSKKDHNEFSKHAPEIDIKKLNSSAVFKTLSKDEQKYYKELEKIKGLINSAKIELTAYDERLIAIKNIPSKINRDSITYKLGTELLFKETDTTKKLQWLSKVVLKENPSIDFKYKYNVAIQTDYVRQKDKTILVTYKINDPNINIDKMYTYTIPVENKSKLNKWVDKNRFTINLIGGSVLFGTGIYIGTKF